MVHGFNGHEVNGTHGVSGKTCYDRAVYVVNNGKFFGGVCFHTILMSFYNMHLHVLKVIASATTFCRPFYHDDLLLSKMASVSFSCPCLVAKQNGGQNDAKRTAKSC